MPGEYLPHRSKTDITVEFYHKTAIYNSPITGCKTPIDIKKVELICTGTGKTYTVVTSTNGIDYLLDKLTLPDSATPGLDWALLIPSGKGRASVVPKVSYSARPKLKLRHVWTEGYIATGEHATATYHGCCLAESFIEACERLVDNLDRNDDGTLRMYKPGHPQVWACSCFDNEKDARKSFG